MKILVINHDLDLVLRKCFEMMQARGHEVIFAGPGEHAAFPEIKSKFTPRAIRGLRTLLCESRPDFVFAHSTSGLSTALLSSVGLNTQIVGYRGTQARVRRSDPTNFLALLNPRVFRIICETPDIVDIVVAAGVKRCKLLQAYKPYSVDWLPSAMQTREPVNPNSLRLICVGHCKGRPHKGLSFLLDAMRSLPGDNLTVIGDVDDKDIACAPGNVRFTGPDSRAVERLSSHDALILPSTRDASPRVLREAQACCLPCLVSDIPGARDLVIPGKTGLLFAPASVQAIVKAVNEMRQMDFESLGRNARRNIIENYGVKDYVDFLETVFAI